VRYFYKPNCWFEYTEGRWRHSTPLKRAVNPILRYIQFWTDRPLVIASLVHFDENKNPNLVGYKIRRVKYERRLSTIQEAAVCDQNDQETIRS
jgi:hypothetical protein